MSQLVDPCFPPFILDGTLIIVGSGPNYEMEYNIVLDHRPKAKTALLGFAASFFPGDFVISDHHETHYRLTVAQLKFHSNFTTHASVIEGYKKIPYVDYFWDWRRTEGSSVETAIKIGQSMGAKEIILCGCPLIRSPMIPAEQRLKDGGVWPPPAVIRGVTKTPSAMLERIQNSFNMFFLDNDCSNVSSMGGFTREILGKPSL